MSATSTEKPARVAAAPATATVLYDGHCRICRASADRIRRLDVGHRLRVTALEEPGLAERYPEISRADVLETMHLLGTDGTILRGADAIREILGFIPGYRWLGLFWLVPGFAPLARRGYGWLARNRYRWNHVVCDGDACRIHSRLT